MFGSIPQKMGHLKWGGSWVVLSQGVVGSVPTRGEEEHLGWPVINLGVFNACLGR